jgi:hypothetical protein
VEGHLAVAQHDPGGHLADVVQQGGPAYGGLRRRLHDHLLGVFPHVFVPAACLLRKVHRGVQLGQNLLQQSCLVQPLQSVVGVRSRDELLQCAAHLVRRRRPHQVGHRARCLGDLGRKGTSALGQAAGDVENGGRRGAKRHDLGTSRHPSFYPSAGRSSSCPGPTSAAGGPGPAGPA